MKKSFWSSVAEFLVLLLVAYVLALGIRMFVAERRDVPTGSMEPTIHAGDSLFTVKALYYFKNPERGDIVVFNVPKSVDPKATFPWVKRVIGLPGDTVEIRDGKVYVNGKVYNVPGASKPKYSYGPVRVEDNMLFVLGDNRNHSFDGHYWGQLPRENVIAKAVFVFWPPKDAKLLK
ncbi:MAG: signal peptidase I [Firmicutes bacterium]|nr:signal peptidase I [Bacillota bacterium]